MKSFLLALSIAVAGLGFGGLPSEAEAKRIGGGKSAGMQRQMPPRTPDNTPATPANPNQASPGVPAAAGAAAAAPGKRSWLGPVAGIAAGLGIAALLSHFGLGEGMANMLTMMLMAAALFFVIRFLMRRFGGGAARQAPAGMQLAGAHAHGGSGPAPFGTPAAAQPMQRTAGEFKPVSAAAAGGISLGKGASAPAGVAVPGFDAQGFERVAKMLFIRLQAANDAQEVDDLRKFTTPELFASLRLDLQERQGAAQRTDVLQLEAEVIHPAQENGQWVVTVRFHGLIREAAEAPAEPFNELWHFVRPLDESRDWAIAGITQAS
ncbi:Tim44 domain-containing protein [Eleftheria terrae]|uniref:Tim44 domain-containing protein n=1 Tax=Eleftheria terrae TaxID=1597781 RepID=UPI00263BAF03|nr:TIM44-like domain-containing protein [Eleftheria terrae]WKB53699.1 Tim44-like domain-containing protein [Eleftheria terrae]